MKTLLMAKNYTENDLVRYLYQDVSEKEKHEIAGQLLINSRLNKCYLQLKNGMNNIESLALEPAQTSIDIILAYSQETSSKNLEVV
jgi:hypothetical protein